MKIMEKIVCEKMVTFLSENNLFNPNQHGFMKGRSCLSALLSVYDEIILNLSNSQMSCTDMIYPDFAKAFDKVDHGVLLHKMKQLGITGKLGNWLLSFLSKRNHFVRIPGGLSSDASVQCWDHIYLRPSMNIINSSDHTRYLGITMSGDGSFLKRTYKYENQAVSPVDR